MPPVLLVLFNRPHLTQKLISILRSVRPPKVYVAIDGPRADRPEEEQKVQEVREIACSIDWTKDVQFLQRETNLGCGPGVSSAIDWFFEQEEEGIILEDDIHPSPDFFPFCQEMLTCYREDERVATIIGYSFVPSSLRHPGGYFFSQYFQAWGWATWRRFWKTYDFKLASLATEEWEKIIRKHSEGMLETLYWLLAFSRIAIGGKWSDVWDHQTQFCIWRNEQVNIIAGNNLVSNEGFRKDATHSAASLNHTCRKMMPLTGPFAQQILTPDAEIDRRTFFWQYIMSDEHLFHLARLCDSEYTWLKEQNKRQQQEIINLKQELTRFQRKN